MKRLTLIIETPDPSPVRVGSLSRPSCCTLRTHTQYTPYMGEATTLDTCMGEAMYVYILYADTCIY